MDEFTALVELCRRLGAPAPQAETMARQLLKRADQLALDRGISREAAMDYLLRLVVKGRNGVVDEALAPPLPPPAPGGENPPNHL